MSLSSLSNKSQSQKQQHQRTASGKHYRAKSITRGSLDLDNSETGALLLAPSGLANDDPDSYPPASSAAPSGGEARSWSTRRMPLGSRRLALILLALVAVVFLFGRRDSRDAVVGYVNDKAGKVNNAYKESNWKFPSSSNGNSGGSNNAVGFPPVAPIDSPSSPAAAPLTGSSSDMVREKPALHSDPSKTTRCESNIHAPLDPHGLPRPLVQYAIMIDAGSTGSRIHVYKFNYCTSSPELEDEYFEMLKGGLSNYGSNPPGAADSLRPLLTSALAKIPKELHRCTPIAVKATAGLRLLPGSQAAEVLKAVRHMLEIEYPFPIAEGINIDGSKATKGVEIMEGKDEGVFAWITVNYLLNRIGSSDKGQIETAAVMDLGGGSTQIVFEPTFTSTLQGMQPGEHVYQLNAFKRAGNVPYTLYQNSYLGYGLMQARMSVNSLAAFTYSLAHPNAVRTGSAHDGEQGKIDWASLTPANTRIPNPCFSNGRTKATLISQPGQATHANVTMIGTDGGFAACKRLVQVMMDKDAVCASRPCSFGGVYQPSMMETFKTAPIIALSYFYDRLEPLGLAPKFKISDLEKLADKVCSYSKDSPPGLFSSKGIAELEDRPETCLDLTFMHGLLSMGYELGDDRELSIAKKLGGTELGWCLGAQLAVLEEHGLLCKA